MLLGDPSKCHSLPLAVCTCIFQHVLPASARPSLPSADPGGSLELLLVWFRSVSSAHISNSEPCVTLSLSLVCLYSEKMHSSRLDTGRWHTVVAQFC